VNTALQIYYTPFDAAFFRLPRSTRDRIQFEIDEMGLRLSTFPHYRLTESDRYRLLVGEYRIIYAFDAAQNQIHLLAVGHHREIYRE
jgi:mRNA-degrading endonuclease RelE of RelBE toxin-antitoxin system